MAPPKQLASQISLDLHEGDSDQLLAFLKCQECSEFAHDAVETLCCRALICAECLVEKRANKCPKCLLGCSHAPSHLARRLIGTQPWRCPSCGKETTRSERLDHSLVCAQTERRCPAPECDFRGLPDNFLLHLTDAHRSELLNRVDRLFEHAARDRRGSDNSSDAASYAEWVRGPRRVYSSSAADVLDTTRTNVQFTNKNYCHEPLNGPACECCDGYCGPNNGCNCVDCMRLDLVTFGIGTTQRALVNREGVVARMSAETGKFYCGRPVMRNDPTTDGFCGPNNGNNCHACLKLDEQLRGRYAAIAAEWEGVTLSTHLINTERTTVLEAVDWVYDATD